MELCCLEGSGLSSKVLSMPTPAELLGVYFRAQIKRSEVFFGICGESGDGGT